MSEPGVNDGGRETGAAALPPVVKRLGVVSFFNDLASEMMYPLIPALVTSLGGGAVSLGLFDGISDALSAVAKLWAGVLADRPRWRRPLIVGGYVVAAFTRPVIGVTTAAWQIITLRATDRIGKGIRNPPRDAVISDATRVDMRGRAFGYHRSMDHAGAVVGPLVAWFLISRVGATPDRVILWSVVPGALAVVAVAWALWETGNGKRETGNVEAASRPPLPASRPRIVFWLVIAFAFARFPETLLLLRLQELSLPVELVPLVWAALHVVRSTGSYPGGWLADRVGPRTVMLGGWFLYWLVTWGLATTQSAAGGVGYFLAFGLVAALTESPERSLVAGAAGISRSGRTFGLYYACVGAAALAGGIVFGSVYARAGGPAALVTSAMIAGLLAVVLLLTGADRS